VLVSSRVLGLYGAIHIYFACLFIKIDILYVNPENLKLIVKDSGTCETANIKIDGWVGNGKPSI